jgi:hypothetical protein
VKKEHTKNASRLSADRGAEFAAMKEYARKETN